jgi:hypothetical protein
MDLDPERDTQRQTYRLCRLGFAIMAAILVLASADAVVFLARLFGFRLLAWIAHTPVWRWLGVPIVWGSLVGSYLLWGRWREPSWQRRAGLLVLMCLVDAVLWIIDHGNVLGLSVGGFGHEWLRSQLGQALGWAEFALIASLAGDLMAHLGADQAPDAAKATRSLAATGAVVWFLYFCEQTIWSQGWPLVGKARPDSLESLLLFLGSQMIWTVTLIQVTALTIAATRQTSQALDEMDREDQDHDLFRSPSETHASLIHPLHDEPADATRDQPGW